MSPSKKIYGLIGYPVKHSLSPAMHNAAFREAGIDAEYKLFEVKPEELEDFFCNPNKKVKDEDGDVIYALNIRGFNITVPHKVRAKEILSRKRFNGPHYFTDITGAINTVRRDPDLWCWNTDAPGFFESLRKDLGLNPKGQKAIVLGCGGAGRAVVAGLVKDDEKAKEVFIYEQDTTAAESADKLFSSNSRFRDKLRFISHEEIPERIRECQLLVNTTPLGMKDNDPSPLDKNLLYKGLYVYDVVYNRNKDTQLIQDAKALGCRYENGLSMLLHQGVLAWGHWTGKGAPVSVMRKALEEAIRK